MTKLFTRFLNSLKNNTILSISIGLVYLLFGILKIFYSLSPAEDIVIQTINSLTFNYISAHISITILAIWESVIGIFLILNCYKKGTLIFAMFHILMTFSPLFLFPESTISSTTFAPTLLGQYIFKNVIIVAALLTLYKEEIKAHKNKLATNL